MAVLDKVTIGTQIDTDLADNGGGAITPALLRGVLHNMLDSYEDIFQSMNTATRNALTGVTSGTIIYNTDTKTLDLYVASTWVALSNVDYFPLDCSTNPNYPEGIPNRMFYVSVAGKIGGGSGKQVNVGDLVFCIATNAGGNEATVGASWVVTYGQGNATNTFNDILMATVNLSQAQIAAMHTTPIDVVLAAGAGTLIMPIKAIVQFTYGGVAYNSVNLQLQYDTGTTPVISLLNISAAASAITVVDPSSAATGVWIANKNLQVITSASAGGSGNGTAKLQVYYKVHTL